jgi:very-short-patch-repair endonuclease
MQKRSYDKNKVLFARNLRQNQTKAENLLWSAIRNRRLRNLKFRRQYPVAGFILDFYCAEKRLAIEIDGEDHDFKIKYDERRTNILNSLDIKIIRFSNEDIYKNLQGVLIEIENLLI